VSEELKPAAPAGRPTYLTRLSFRQDDHSVIVSVADVIWIEAEDYYVLVHTRQGRHLVRAPLASFEGRLDPQRFVRVHRAAIVNVAEVREVHEAGGLLLVLSDGSHVPVSRSRRRQVEPLMVPRGG
jgi:two-component system LytT family response regulator